jgi:exosortase
MAAESAPPPLSAAAIMSSLVDAAAAFAAWARREPRLAWLVAAIAATLVYFYGFYRVFMNGAESTAEWTVNAWNPENDLEHGWIILPVALAIVWWHRRELKEAPKETSRLGLAITIGGVLLFIFAVRTIQGRLAIFSLPLLAYGSVRYLFGRQTARHILFPCAFLLFMVPLGFLVSRTVGLQNLAATVAAKFAGLLGIRVVADGAAIHALDGSFDFEVSGGCSGIRSLTAMTMLAALWVHFTQDTLWKKVLIFCSSLFFALLGNLMRIFSVVLFARFIDVKFAATVYHDWSGFIFFPFAVGGMLAFSNLLNRDWSYWLGRDTQPETAPAALRESVPTVVKETAPAAKAAPRSPISYDY